MMVVNIKPKRRSDSRLTDRALVHVLVASTSDEASRTGANGTSIQRVGVTHCAFVARVTDTRIIEVAQQTCGEVRAQLANVHLSVSAVQFHINTGLRFDFVS